MTDRADRTFRILKLLRVTTSARQMLRCCRAFWHGGIRIAPMTEQAWKSRVILTAVLEFRVIQVCRELHLRLGRLNFRGIDVSTRVNPTNNANYGCYRERK